VNLYNYSGERMRHRFGREADFLGLRGCMSNKHIKAKRSDNHRNTCCISAIRMLGFTGTAGKSGEKRRGLKKRSNSFGFLGSFQLLASSPIELSNFLTIRPLNYRIYNHGHQQPVSRVAQKVSVIAFSPPHVFRAGIKRARSLRASRRGCAASWCRISRRMG
jgi:hypothetical protein